MTDGRNAVDEQATAKTKARYNRLARIYDRQEAALERFAFTHWRERIWSQIEGSRVLEVGVGTGKNLPYYPEKARIVAVDLSDKMMAQAKRRAQRLGAKVDLSLMDVQRLAFADNIFDAAVGTFVFCSVPDAVTGLREVSRVVKPGGKLILLEHVRVNKPVVGWLMDVLDPLVVRVMGLHINRATTENVKKAGLEIEGIEELVAGGLVKIITARTKQAKVGTAARRQKSRLPDELLTATTDNLRLDLCRMQRLK
jgi:ubiquinone/menaquinone biosynthesis C-methylase UbiE